MKFSNSQQVYRYLVDRMTPDVEELWAIALTSHLQMIDAKCIFRGTVDRCLIHPRDIFRFAFKANASNLILSHNHPSGDPLPSNLDLIWTRRLLVIANMMDLPILDHIVVGRNRHFSMAERGVLSKVDYVKTIDRVLAHQGK